MPQIEPPVDPDIPVIDAHHHLFDWADDALAALWARRSLLAGDYAGLVTDGHNVIASVAVESHAGYRASGPEHLRPVGQTEFMNGQAATAGAVRVAAGIIGWADLRLGAAVREVLEAHLVAAPRRFKGIRYNALWDEDPSVVGALFDHPPHLYGDKTFRAGFAEIAPFGLVFDAFVLAPQLPDVTALARAFPETPIVLNHLGNPLGVGRHAGRMTEEFPAWRKAMTDLATCPNVVVKMGGLGTFLSGSPSFRADPPVGSEVLAGEWRPYTEETIALFGADRVMFESNLPTDGCGSFRIVCNAYQRIVEHCSDDERRAIFAGTATAVYRLDLEEV
ncbi:amidohydrolase [Amycolatopsis sp. GM8]|uniref:amidohydrolase family protein n=1 Tax=Amycolatopsis sp. GM8 TaxID=2896530 RepID=UPI001F2E6D0E|nr:amidohydrolase family protein [Amycolatopsis sp. GM8]